MREGKMTSEQVAAQQPAAAAFAEAAAIMARLRRVPDGCPWDLQQSFDSIKPHTLEEVYEVFDAIDRRDWPHLKDELGDLLLQVLFYAQIATDQGHFDIAEVVQGLSAKLLRRHPHIFGDALATTPDDVVATWDSVKRKEKSDNQADKSLLDSIPRTMPALLEARKIGSKASKIGFDWPDASGIFDKLQEEITEVREELAHPVPDQTRVEEEFGDLLFTVANLARHLKVDPEQVLKKANAKFRRRFQSMEENAGGADRLQTMSSENMELAWNRVKESEKLA